MPRRRVATCLMVAVLALGPSSNAEHAASPRRSGPPTWLERGGPSPGPRDSAVFPAPSGAAAASRYSVRLAGGGKHLIVEGTLNNTLSGPMLIDTGASYCVLTRESARRLGLAPMRSKPVSVATANGNVAADLVQLASVRIADARLAWVDALIMDAVEPPLIGIIGLSYLNHFRYSVDPARGTIHLER